MEGAGIALRRKVQQTNVPAKLNKKTLKER